MLLINDDRVLLLVWVIVCVRLNGLCVLCVCACVRVSVCVCLCVCVAQGIHLSLLSPDHPGVASCSRGIR